MGYTNKTVEATSTGTHVNMRHIHHSKNKMKKKNEKKEEEEEEEEEKEEEEEVRFDETRLVLFVLA